MEKAGNETERDARVFARLIRAGEMTIEEARSDLLISARQAKEIREMRGLPDIREHIEGRQRIWRELIRIFKEEK